MKPTIRLLAAWLLLLAGSAWAQPIEVQDMLDRTVSLERPAARIVSLMPSHTETLIALGAGDLLVGVDGDSPMPAGLDLPRLGSGFQPNLELIVSLEPDLVLTDAFSGLHAQLADLGMMVFAGTPETVAQVLEFNQVLGELTGFSAEALLLSGEQQLQLNLAASLTADLEPPTVYVELDPTPFTAGPGSYVDDLLRAVGAVNVVPEELGPWPMVSNEFVSASAPDVVLLLDAPFGETEESFRTRTGLTAAETVVVEVAAGPADLLSRPGPGLGQALDWLLGQLHPGVAGE